MSDPQRANERWLAGNDSELRECRELLQSVYELPAPPPAARQQGWRRLSIMMAGAAALTTTTPAAATVPTKTVITGWVLKGLLVTILGGGGALMGLRASSHWLSKSPAPAHAVPLPAATLAPAAVVAPASSGVEASENREAAATRAGLTEPGRRVGKGAAPLRAMPVVSAAPTLVNTSPSSTLEQQNELLHRARQSVSQGDGRRALAILAEHRRAYPSSVLTQEREVLTIEALAAAGESRAARARAEKFVDQFPTSPHTRRVTRYLHD